MSSILIARGETGTFPGQVLRDGIVVNITGARIDFVARTGPDHGITSLSRISHSTATSGVAITDAPNGKYAVTLLPADTSAIVEDVLYHEVWLTEASGTVSRIDAGLLTLVGSEQ